MVKCLLLLKSAVSSWGKSTFLSASIFDAHVWRFALVCLVLSHYSLTAQDHSYSPDQSPIWAFETGGSFSYSGINAHLNALWQVHNHEFFAGPKWVLTDTYLLSRGPWGLNVGYRYHLIALEKRKSFASLEYQGVYYRPFSGRRTSLHETFLSYGFQWRLSPRVWLGNNLGLGGVFERSKAVGQSASAGVTGFSILVKIFAVYQFKKNE